MTPGSKGGRQPITAVTMMLRPPALRQDVRSGRLAKNTGMTIMNSTYSQYQKEICEDISKVMSDAECQPILFVGSGLSKRYANGPNWEELLKSLAERCPKIEQEFAYYKQTYSGDLKKIGSVFSNDYKEWAWREGRDNFPEECFQENAPIDTFIKHEIAKILEDLDSNPSTQTPDLAEEIQALKSITPHAIITTNYDRVIEAIFPDYKAIVGQKIVRQNHLSIGEIFKIHGCISEPNSLVFNEDDYKKFDEEQMYLSAKLLTYFIEHPLIFIGYSAEDPNIKKILHNVYRMASDTATGLVENIYIIQWSKAVTSLPAREHIISVADGINIRIKSITTDSFTWVFKQLGETSDLEPINLKLLRALSARMFELIRSDIPKKHVEIDFQKLSNQIETRDGFAKIFGVTSLNDPSSLSLHYRYSLTDIGKKLDFSGWHGANKLIGRITDEKGVDIKSSDNKYHITQRTGNSAQSTSHRYSEDAFDLLQKVKNNEPYEIDLSRS